jgi:hypothetical protein
LASCAKIPNPFNAETSIEFSLPESGKTTLIIFNSKGQELMRLIDDNIAAGYYDIKWSASELPSGVYFYRLRTPGYESVKKCVLLK